MKSPFPGMDPFIEGCGLWGDFHNSLIAEIHRTLADAVSDRYIVRTGERSYIVIEGLQGRKDHPFLPDVGVKDPGFSGKAFGGTAIAVTEPATEPEELDLRAFIEVEFRETFVEIFDASPPQRLVTSIEVLSPSNKFPNTPGWDLYQRKRQALLLGEANLVEIDLLRGGQRPPMLDPWPNSPYTLLVARSNRRGRCRVWPAYSLKPLPALPVPLLKPDPDVLMNLQPMIEAIYKRSRYEPSIDYHKALTPPLAPEEAAWLAQHQHNQSSAPPGQG